ncbi:MAG TPA: 3-deoxy-7-phosphoheptulonate synthase [Acidimicrobiales bacterium]|nr:3-deoxy-7-phosphoheptulonate synthase [Acidimicrobiales bacterium]
MTTDEIRDQRIRTVRPLVAPADIRRQLPLTERGRERVLRDRRNVKRILDAEDQRLLVIVGPCSIHDPTAALDYARRLAKAAERLKAELCIVMRVYFEKPRSTTGWKGLINDPGLDGRFDVNGGLRLARSLILEILDLDLAVGCEFLDPITPQFIADTVSWGFVGARTSQSQIHRQLASGLSMPVGFKNSTDGDLQVAVDAVAVANSEHVFPGVDDGGRASIFSTTGNADCHIVLRGSTSGSNYDDASLDEAIGRLRSAGLPERLVVDASHGNSNKEHHRQSVVIAELANRIASGARDVRGVMIESFIEAGRQDLNLGHASKLTYGQSVTDACIGWEESVLMLDQLAEAVRRSIVERTALTRS